MTRIKNLSIIHFLIQIKSLGFRDFLYRIKNFVQVSMFSFLIRIIVFYFFDPDKKKCKHGFHKFHKVILKYVFYDFSSNFVIFTSYFQDFESPKKVKSETPKLMSNRLFLSKITRVLTELSFYDFMW